MTFRRSAFVVGLVCIALNGAVQAAPIFVPNFSFENPDLLGDIGLGNSVQSVPNWTQTVISLFPSFAVFDPANSQFPGTTGDNAPLPGTAQGGQAAVIDAGGKGSLTTALPWPRPSPTSSTR